MPLEFLSQIFDHYDRKARLAPALLALVPVLAVIFFYHGVTFDWSETLLSSLAVLGLFYLLASTAREAGKRREGALFAEWGGKPSTQLLRHGDRAIDPVTKARVHKFLSASIGVALPNQSEEKADREAADHIYESAANWLREATRDHCKYNLLFNENISYGFRRNGFGLRPLAVLIALLCMFWVQTHSGFATAWAFEFRLMPVGGWIAIAIAVCSILFWVFFFSKETVRTSAFTYADTLLRCCDRMAH